MNTVLTFLRTNWKRLSLEPFGDPNCLSSVVLTPRFRASSHVVFLVFAGQKPVLVAKVPRLAGDQGRLQREADNLRFVQAAKPGGFESVPRLIGFEEHRSHDLLIETAIDGQSLSSRLKIRPHDVCSESVIRWITDLHLATWSRTDTAIGWYERLVEKPLNEFVETMPASGRESQLVAQTLESTWTARQESIPLVCEHGDLGPPNVLVQSDNAIGIVDWELANPQGLPAADLFFFLTLLAFHRGRTRGGADYLAEFDRAFFGPAAWARPYITRYAKELELPAPVVSQLFLLSWARYFAALVERLRGELNAGMSPETLGWLRANRYYELWCHTIDQADRLNLVE